jgi:glycosyltransferase 2 family protein
MSVASAGGRLSGAGAWIRRRASRSALSWAGLAVSAFFAYLAVRHVRFGDVWEGLRSSNYWWLIPAFALLAVTVYLKAVRWRYLFAPETRPGIRPVVDALLIGYFFNSILPARAGEAARVLALHQRAGTSRAEAAATVVTERAYDVLVLLVLLFVTLPWLPHVTWLHAAVVLGVVIAGGIAVAMVVLAVFGVRPVHFALRPFGRLPFLSGERIMDIGENLAHGLAAVRRPRLVLAALFWTTIAWLALAVSTWFVLRGFHVGVPLLAGLLVVIATNLAQVLPSSPSALGVFEAATLVALHAYGIPGSRSLPCALVLHVLNLLPFLVAGFVLLRGTFRFGRIALEETALEGAEIRVNQSG